MSDEDANEEMVFVREEDLPAVVELAAANGVVARRHDRKEVGATVALILFGSILAVSTVVHLIDVAKGGQVIDLRADAQETFYRTDNLVYGLVVIIATDGRVVVEVKEPRGMFGTVVDTLARTLANVDKTDRESIAKAANEAVGDIAIVRKADE